MPTESANINPEWSEDIPLTPEESPLVKSEWEEDIPLCEESQQVEVDAIGTTAPDDAYEVRTSHSFATHPMSKGAVVIGASFMLMSFLGIFFKAMTGGFSSNTNTVTQEPKPSLATAANSISEADTLKSKLLQANQSKDIKDFKRNKQAVPAVAPPAPNPSPVKSSVPVAVAPRTVYASRPNYPTQIPARSVISVPNRVAVAPTPQTAQRLTLPPPPPVTPRIETPPRQEKPKEDPVQQWLLAANMGSSGDASQQSSLRTNNYPSARTDNSNSVTSGGSRIPPGQTINATTLTASNSIAQLNEVSDQTDSGYQNVNYLDSVSNVVVGTRADGKLETPVAWSGQFSNLSQNFLIELTEPLKGANNSTVIPKGAYLVARVNDATNTGLIQMSVVSVITNEDGQPIERPVPNGSLMVLGKGGNPLRAKAQGRRTSSTLITSVLSGLGNAAGLINQPSSQSVFSSGGGFQTTTTNREPNYLASFGQGVAQSLAQQMQQGNQRALQSSESERVFVLEQGASVQVFVNQSVSL